jgi:hypothetical protein
MRTCTLGSSRRRTDARADAPPAVLALRTMRACRAAARRGVLVPLHDLPLLAPPKEGPPRSIRRSASSSSLLLLASAHRYGLLLPSVYGLLAEHRLEGDGLVLPSVYGLVLPSMYPPLAEEDGQDGLGEQEQRELVRGSSKALPPSSLDPKSEACARAW